jgi:putative membrane protein
MAGPTPKASVLGQRESHFSWLRTRLSIERTLMSWIRTATALIGFGFTIFQFFERFNEMEGVAPARSPMMPRLVSLALIGIGTGGMIVALLEYRTMLRYLWAEEFRDIAGLGDRPPWTPVIVAGVLLAVVGVLAFGAILLRTGVQPKPP